MQKITLHAFKMSRKEGREGGRGEERGGFTVFSATTQRWMKGSVYGCDTECVSRVSGRYEGRSVAATSPSAALTLLVDWREVPSARGQNGGKTTFLV